MNIAVYCGSVSGNKEQFEKGARALGTWIGEHGHTLVYGGAQGGLMGIVADAVLEHGGLVTGGGIHSEEASSGSDSLY